MANRRRQRDRRKHRVPSIHETLAQIIKAGGSVVIPRTEVPGILTFALFNDPAGNLLGLAEDGTYPRS
jgi:predicted enzyme related to lactoylglutathione lyase